MALQLRQDDFVAYLFVEVDGQPANALPVDGGGNSYIILTSGTRGPELGLTTVAAPLQTIGETAVRNIVALTKGATSTQQGASVVPVGMDFVAVAGGSWAASQACCSASRRAFKRRFRSGVAMM